MRNGAGDLWFIDPLMNIPPSPTSKSAPNSLGTRISAILDTDSQEDPSHAAGKWADALLADAVDAGAPDIHVDPRKESMMLRFRINGVLHDIRQLETETGQRLVRYFKANSDLNPVAYSGPEDAHFEFDSDLGMMDVRVACAPCLSGEKMTLRLLPQSRIQLGLEELGHAEDDLERIHVILGELLNTGSCVITIEDPAEYRAEGANQIEVDEDVGVTFSNGLRTALRLDPDQILLGEIRDGESARTALRAAGTGHTILSSMHGSSAAGVTTALRSFGLTDPEIAHFLPLSFPSGW